MSEPLVGSTIIMQITVEDPHTGLPADASVTVVLQAPDGTETSPSPTHPGTGIYEITVDLDQEGWWTAVWTATSGDLTTVKECAVCASPTALVSV